MPNEPGIDGLLGLLSNRKMPLDNVSRLASVVQKPTLSRRPGPEVRVPGGTVSSDGRVARELRAAEILGRERSG